MHRPPRISKRHKFAAIAGGKKPREISTDPSDAEAQYPLNEFLVPVQDSHGHSARAITRMPPGMKQQINIILQTGIFPWETESDFIRWCVYRGLLQVEEKARNPEITSLQALMNSWVAACRYEMEQLHYAQVLDRISESARKLIDQGHWPRAQKLLEEVKENVDMIDEPYWNKRYRKLLEERRDEILRIQFAKEEPRRVHKKKERADTVKERVKKKAGQMGRPKGFRFNTGKGQGQ